VIVFLVLAALSGLAAAAGVAQRQARASWGPPISRRSPRRMSQAELTPIAKKWADARGLPLAWVLATIKVESGDDATKLNFREPQPGAKGEASIGLMQINWLAHGKRLTAAGLSPDDLYDPETNIRLGTEILAGNYADARRTFAGKTPPVSLADITRLAYKGLSPSNWLTKSPETPAARCGPSGGCAHPLARWRAALAQVGGSQLVA
jgi:hypothetical protein